MEKKDAKLFKYSSLPELHRMLGLPGPLHPLVTLIDTSAKAFDSMHLPESHTSDFYKISYKKELTGELRYGQHQYEFDQGGLFFVAPNQVTSRGNTNEKHSGYTLIIHPDFLLGYPLARKIRHYGFFSYGANEALHLSDKEKETVLPLFRNIAEELHGKLDDFSQDVIISQIESLLNYSNRFYKRQFLTRKAVNATLLQQLESILDDYFNDEKALLKGIPTVKFLADNLHLSPGYLSDMLRSFTGQNAQQHIQSRIIEKAKEKLSTTELSIGEIAYELGFDHSQSFSRFFKSKTSLSPLEFRQSFN